VFVTFEIYHLSTKSVDKTVHNFKVYRQNSSNFTLLLNRLKTVQEFKLLKLKELV